MTSNQPTVRVNALAKKKLDRMQEQTALSQPALMDRAIELLERELMAQQLKSDFEAIASDPKTLAQYQAIASGFEGTARDGLKHK